MPRSVCSYIVLVYVCTVYLKGMCNVTSSTSGTSIMLGSMSDIVR